MSPVLSLNTQEGYLGLGLMRSTPQQPQPQHQTCPAVKMRETSTEEMDKAAIR